MKKLVDTHKHTPVNEERAAGKEETRVRNFSLRVVLFRRTQVLIKDKRFVRKLVR